MKEKETYQCSSFVRHRGSHKRDHRSYRAFPSRSSEPLESQQSKYCSFPYLTKRGMKYTHQSRLAIRSWLFKMVPDGVNAQSHTHTHTHTQNLRKLVSFSHTRPNGQGGTNLELKSTARVFQCLGHGLVVPIMVHSSDSEDPRRDETCFEECARDQRVRMITDLFDRVEVL